MTTKTVGRTTVTLPQIDPTYLAPVDSLVSADTVRDFLYEGQDLRSLDLIDGHLQDGRINRLSARTWVIGGTTLSSVEISDCDITSLTWSGAKARRTVFRNCRLMGAQISDVSFDDVLFEDCRLTYAAFDRVRALGPVAFVRCKLEETTFTGCDLSDAAFRDCVLDRTTFGTGTYHHLDLRGNDLSTIAGTASIQHTIIDRAQADQLTHALLTELKVTFGEDLPR
ncbi:pentapeptide repeat-containing protein [Kitasatospora sp. NPDC057542]|uniref:pentapeptide repeat-containing protein n=1 Tax=Kitasatospora sp. NPDC057542 TaxID=3346162 RepID=UPI0036834033